MRFSTLSLLVALLFAIATPAHAAIGVVVPATTEAGTPVTKADVAAATAAYKAKLEAMTAKERRAFKKDQKRDMRSAVKQYKQQVKDGVADPDTGDVLLIILAILLPPLAVFLHQGEINNKFWISLVLTLLVWVPGIIYALLVVTGNAKKKK